MAKTSFYEETGQALDQINPALTLTYKDQAAASASAALASKTAAASSAHDALDSAAAAGTSATNASSSASAAAGSASAASGSATAASGSATAASGSASAASGSASAAAGSASAAAGSATAASGSASSAGTSASNAASSAAAAATSASLLRGMHVFAEDFGAVPTLVGDNTTAINNAIAYLHSQGGGTLRFGRGYYRHTGPLVVGVNGITFEGSGVGFSTGTTLYFDSLSRDVAAIEASAGTGILSNLTIKNLTIENKNVGTNFHRYGVRVKDGSFITLRDVMIRNFNGGHSATITNAVASPSGEIRLTVANASINWTDGWAVAVSGVQGTTEANSGWPIVVSGGSTIDLKGSKFVNAFTAGTTGTITATSEGLRSCGRELLSVEDVAITADLPVRISKNPNFAFSGLDQTHFFNTTLSATSTSPCFMVDDGVGMTSLTIDGVQSWGGGKSAFQWLDNSGAAISEQILLANIRAEQKVVAGGWYVDIRTNAPIYSLTVDNLLAADRGGIRARNVANLSILKPHFLGNADPVLDIDSTVQSTTVLGGYFIAGSTAVLTGQTLLFGTKNATGGAMPPIAFYSATAGDLTLYGVSGSWAPYSPTLVSAAGGALGTGNTITGSFKIMGKTCFVRIKVVMGASGMGSATQVGVTLPAAAVQICPITLQNFNAGLGGIALVGGTGSLSEALMNLSSGGVGVANGQTTYINGSYEIT